MGKSKQKHAHKPIVRFIAILGVLSFLLAPFLMLVQFL